MAGNVTNGAAGLKRAENRNGDGQSELLMSLEQLLIANMLWMSR